MLKDISSVDYTEKQLTSWARRVRKLPRSKIDEVWYSCGWVVLDHEEDLRALRDIDINHIKKNLFLAKQKIKDLISESYIKEFEKHLSRVEKEK